MAIDKIIVEFQAETTKLKKELDDLKSRLGNVETAAKDAGKNTGKALDDVGKNANGLKDTIKNLGQQIAAAFAAREIIRFTKQTIDAASDLNETLSKSQQIFGDASKAVEDFASNSAKQFGQSKQQAIDAAASFGVFGKAAGLTGEDLSTFSTDLVALSADLASFGNTTPEEAALALGAALRGEAEPIRRFGVLLDDATLKQEALAMGIIKTTKGALTPQQKVLAANAVILKQTADAQGDFARTSDGVANQQRILEATFKDLQTEIGQKLLPTFNSALTSLNEFLGDLDAEDVMSFAKAIGFVATAFGAFKLGSLIKDMGGLTGMLKATTGGVQGLSKAVMSNPFGLLATAAAALIAYGPDILDMLNGVNEAQRELDDIAYKATENLRKEQAELNLVGEALAKTNPGSEERARLLQRFNELSPQGIADLKDTFDLNNQLATAMAGANAQYDNRIKKIGLEAAATAAAQKQIELKAKITAEEDRLVQETGMSYDEVRKSVEDYIEYQKTGAFPALARAKNLLRGGVGDLAQLQYAYSQTTQQTQRIKAETDAFNTSMNKNSVMANKSGSGFSFLSGTLSKFGQKVEETKAKWSMFQGAVSGGVGGDEGGGDPDPDADAAAAAATERAKKLKEINAQFNKEMMSLADELTLMMIADEDERAQKQLQIQKAAELASIDASEFTADQKGKLKAQIDAKYDQLEITRQQTQNEKLKKGEEDYQRFLEEQGLKSEEAAKEAEDRKYSAYLELWQMRQENELLGIENEKERKLKELEIHEQNEIAKVEASEFAGEIIAEIQKKYAALRIKNEIETQKATNIAMADGFSQLSSGFGQMVSSFAQISGEGAEYTKALAVIGVQIQLATALAAAIAGATTAAAATGPGAPFALAGYIASMVGAVVAAFAQTTQLLTAEVPKPAFYEGTAYLQRGGNPKGKDTIPVMAHEGEAIIPTGKNLQYPGLAKSWIDGSLDGYINNNFVRPALMEQQRQAEEDFADRLANSMALQMSSNFDDYRLFRAIKEQTAVNRTGFETMKINRKKIRGGR
jgi:hypothetical protein